MTTNSIQSAQNTVNPKANWFMRHKILSAIIGLLVLVLIIAIATPSSTPPAQQTSSESSISKACDDAFSSAAAVSDKKDTNEDLLPAFSACQDLEEWMKADKLYPAAIDSANPIEYAANVCTNNKEEVGDTIICKAIAAGIAAREESKQEEVNAEPTPEESKQEEASEPEPTPSETVSQKNAVAKAKSYLEYTAFSHDGLVDQLEYEQFSHADAVYGADNCGADWNEQAAKKAEDYMEYSAFSRGSLIEQLLYEKFTQAQAEYGVNAVGL